LRSREDRSEGDEARANPGSCDIDGLDRRHGHREQTCLIVAGRIVERLDMNSVWRFGVFTHVVQGRIDGRAASRGEQERHAKNERAAPA